MLTVAPTPPITNSSNKLKLRNRQRPGSPRNEANTTPPKARSGPNSLERALLELQSNASDDQERLQALDHLEKILAKWASSISGSNNSWQRPRVSLVTFGSYRLGVHRKTSDLDVLALSPPFCTRQDFFTSLVELLQDDPKVSDLHPIPGAYTPVLKFQLDRYQIDLLFCRVQDASNLLAWQRQRVSPLVVGGSGTTTGRREEYSITDQDMQGLDDEASVRSMNGARVSQYLMEHVPNLQNFQTVLIAVKEWAIKVGIYGNSMGFLGGINWAIMVAWVCERNPQASSAELLRRFFFTFAAWKWPKPVLLGPIQDTPTVAMPPMIAWNPAKYPRDGLHVCPIITPVYPSMNSSYNVGIPQLRRIQEELVLACQILQQDPKNFGALFQKTLNFFDRHEHYLQVTIRAATRQDFLEWFRLVESRLRLLIVALETPQVHAWPYSRFFTFDENEAFFYIALRFAPGTEELDLGPLTSDFQHNVLSSNRKESMELDVAHVRRHKLPDFVGVHDLNTKKSNKASSSTSTKDHKKPAAQIDEESPRSEEKAVAEKDDSSPSPNKDDSPPVEASAQFEEPVPTTPATECATPPRAASSGKGSSPDLASPSKKCRITTSP